MNESSARKQHTSPCAECPFARTVEPGALGGSSPLTYVGQANGPFAVPCHATHDYKDLEARLAAGKPGGGNECAGLAIFRANAGVEDKAPPSLLHLPADEEKVFASFAEFLAHHAGLTAERAEQFLREFSPDLITRVERARSLAKVREGTAVLHAQKKPDAKK